MVGKTIFLSISVFFSEMSLFWLKSEVLCEFSKKCFKTTERHSLTVCGTHWGEKQFLLIFVPFYWFDQKKLLKQIQIFLRISHFSNMVRKTNFLSISVLICDIVTFMCKNKSSYEFPQKCFKTTERHSLALCGSRFGEKHFFKYLSPLTGLIKNSCLNKSNFSSRFAFFKHGRKNKLS